MSTTSLEKPAVHYDPMAKLLHWLVAGAIVLQYVLAKLSERAEETGSTLSQLALLANHKSVGMTILVVAIGRLIWRVSHRPPALPATMARWQQLASHVSHWSLYALLFALPITGWLMSSASAYSVSWFNLFQFPDLIGASADAKHQLKDIHETLAKVLFVIALVHILAALKHALFDRDGILRRISSAPALSAFGVVVASGLAFLAQGSADPGAGDGQPVAAAGVSEIEAQEITTTVDTPVQAEPAVSALPVWEIATADSRIEFTGDQAGASFTGVWQRFDAKLQFDPADLAQSRFDVTIDTASMATGDSERDDTMTQSEWFDSAKYPQAFFRASRFEQTDEGYVAKGQLVIKDKSVATEFHFTVAEQDDSRTLIGRSELDRLALDVGTGEWTDTTWVGQTVVVDVQLKGRVAR